MQSGAEPLPSLHFAWPFCTRFQIPRFRLSGVQPGVEGRQPGSAQQHGSRGASARHPRQGVCVFCSCLPGCLPLLALQAIAKLGQSSLGVLSQPYFCAGRPQERIYVIWQPAQGSWGTPTLPLLCHCLKPFFLLCNSQVGPNNERIYVYDGLYKVVEAKMVPSSDGPLVCRCEIAQVTVCKAQRGGGGIWGNGPAAKCHCFCR